MVLDSGWVWGWGLVGYGCAEWLCGGWVWVLLCGVLVVDKYYCLVG